MNVICIHRTSMQIINFVNVTSITVVDDNTIRITGAYSTAPTTTITQDITRLNYVIRIMQN